MVDQVKQAQLAVTCLTGTAYTWYAVRGFSPATTRWGSLKSALLGYFRPPDYAHKTRVELSKCRQGGRDVTAYVAQYSACLNECTDVDEAEALFRFIDGLHADVQCLVRL